MYYSPGGDTSRPSGLHVRLCHTYLVSVGGAVVVSMVFGVPTIKRERESYLSRTLRSLIDSLNEEESMDCLIVVMVCEVCCTSFMICNVKLL